MVLNPLEAKKKKLNNHPRKAFFLSLSWLSRVGGKGGGTQGCSASTLGPGPAAACPHVPLHPCPSASLGSATRQHRSYTRERPPSLAPTAPALPYPSHPPPGFAPSPHDSPGAARVPKSCRDHPRPTSSRLLRVPTTLPSCLTAPHPAEDRALLVLKTSGKATNARFGTNGPFFFSGVVPSKASFTMHSILVNHFLHGAWYPKGGAGEIAFHTIPVIRKTGGNVLGKAPVQRILLDSQGKACGERWHGTGHTRLLPATAGLFTAAVPPHLAFPFQA